MLRFVTITLIPLYLIEGSRELIAKILEFGTDMEVLAPASLRQKIAEAR